MNSGDMLANTRPTAAIEMTRCAEGRRLANAAAPAARNTAADSATSGTARGVERNARPESERVNDSNSEPYGEGWSNGKAPTDTTRPAIDMPTKNTR